MEMPTACPVKHSTLLGRMVVRIPGGTPDCLLKGEGMWQSGSLPIVVQSTLRRLLSRCIGMVNYVEDHCRFRALLGERERAPHL